jgi:predicted ribonuclease YlaK
MKTTMAKKKQFVADVDNVPETLENHPFYGLELDDEQKVFRDAIWSYDKPIVFCNAKAGTGKTTIATAVANLLVQYGRYDGIVYISAPVQEAKQGFLPGTIEEKSQYYAEPFYDALERIGVNINISTYDDIMNAKNGTAYIKAITHTFLRGTNFENKIVIVDESQNFYFDELKKVLTRMHDSCKVIVIGHSRQCDIYYNPERSGFVKYLNHFAKSDKCAICELTKNYRGWISTYADELE